MQTAGSSTSHTTPKRNVENGGGGEDVLSTGRESASPVLYIPWLNEAAVEGAEPGTGGVLRKVLGRAVGVRIERARAVGMVERRDGWGGSTRGAPCPRTRPRRDRGA